MAVMLTILMFSLAGIPPLARFLREVFRLCRGVEAGSIRWPLSVCWPSVVVAYYYLRIVKVMFFDEPAEAFQPMPTELKVVLGLSGVFVVFFWVMPGPVVTAATAAAQSLF
jgi:NADH-quinone oxidoreductase subunit N